MEWKTSWSYLPLNFKSCIGTAENITQRAFFRNNLGGTKIKIGFSNIFAKEQLRFDDVTAAKIDRGSGALSEFKTVTRGGKKEICVGPGEEFYSDDVDLAISSNEDIMLTAYVGHKTRIFSVCSTWAAKSWRCVYGLNGNYTRERDFDIADEACVYPEICGTNDSPNNLFGITSVQVYTDGVVTTAALFGDSVTHMSYYSDVLTEELFNRYPGKVTVINRGIGGNRLLHGASRMTGFPGEGSSFGAAGVKRFYTDVYGHDRPELVIALIGINDFVHPYVFGHTEELITVGDYQKGMSEIIKTAHENGSRIYLGTVTPFKNDNIAMDWYDKAEKLRHGVNDWIREQNLSDGYADFDAAVSKKGAPEYMEDGCHLGDGLHPNTAGGEKMTGVIKMEWFENYEENERKE